MGSQGDRGPQIALSGCRPVPGVRGCSLILITVKIVRSHTLSSQPRGGARHSGIDSSGQQGAAGRSRQHDGAPTRDLLGERGVDKALGHDDPTTLTQSLYTTRFRPLRSWRLGRYIGSFKNQHEHPGSRGTSRSSLLPIFTSGKVGKPSFGRPAVFTVCACLGFAHAGPTRINIPRMHRLIFRTPTSQRAPRGTRASPAAWATQMLEQENSLQMSNSRSSPREERAIADTP